MMDLDDDAWIMVKQITYNMTKQMIEAVLYMYRVLCIY